MQQRQTKLHLLKLKEKLRRARVASWSAIERGDYRAVAKWTCETVRLREFLEFAQH
jgi:hypothetical protein